MRPKISLVISDVDGTLVDDAKQVTDASVRAVGKLGEAGIGFTIVSSRPAAGIRWIAEKLQIAKPLGALNGALILDSDFAALEQYPLAPEAAAQTVDIMLQHQLDIWLYTKDEWMLRDPRGPHAEYEAAIMREEPVVVQTFESNYERGLKIVGISDDHAAVERCDHAVNEALGHRASATRSQPFFLDVTDALATKGRFVLAVSKRLGIPCEEIACIGDGYNDILMFEKAGLSVAMGNGHDDVKKAARFQTLPNTEEGFAHALETFILNR